MKLVMFMGVKKKKCWTASVELMLPDSNRNHRREGTIANQVLCEVSTWLSQRLHMLKQCFYKYEYLASPPHYSNSLFMNAMISFFTQQNQFTFSRIPNSKSKICTHTGMAQWAQQYVYSHLTLIRMTSTVSSMAATCRGEALLTGSLYPTYPSL